MKTKIKVEGMTCNHCKMSVEKAALDLDFVKKAAVNLKKGELSLVLNEAGGTLDKVKAAVREAGYEPV